MGLPVSGLSALLARRTLRPQTSGGRLLLTLSERSFSSLEEDGSNAGSDNESSLETRPNPHLQRLAQLQTSHGFQPAGSNIEWALGRQRTRLISDGSERGLEVPAEGPPRVSSFGSTLGCLL